MWDIIWNEQSEWSAVCFHSDNNNFRSQVLQSNSMCHSLGKHLVSRLCTTRKARIKSERYACRKVIQKPSHPLPWPDSSLFGLTNPTFLPQLPPIFWQSETNPLRMWWRSKQSIRFGSRKRRSRSSIQIPTAVSLNSTSCDQICIGKSFGHYWFDWTISNNFQYAS